MFNFRDTSRNLLRFEKCISSLSLHYMQTIKADQFEFEFEIGPQDQWKESCPNEEKK